MSSSEAKDLGEDNLSVVLKSNVLVIGAGLAGSLQVPAHFLLFSVALLLL